MVVKHATTMRKWRLDYTKSLKEARLTLRQKPRVDILYITPTKTHIVVTQQMLINSTRRRRTTKQQQNVISLSVKVEKAVVLSHCNADELRLRVVKSPVL